MASKVRQGNIAKISYSEIARRVGCSRSTVAESIQQLTELGKIIQKKQGPRSPAIYELVSGLFGQKQRDGVTTIVSSPRGGRRMVTVGPEKIRA
jgi:transposase